MKEMRDLLAYDTIERKHQTPNIPLCQDFRFGSPNELPVSSL